MRAAHGMHLLLPGVCLGAWLGACADPRDVPPPDTCTNTIHPCDIKESHKQLIQDQGWDLNICARCHGQDFSGGPSGVSCKTCHQNGPTACDTCHGQPPQTGAHLTHLAQGVVCSTCHVVPERWDSPGHIRTDGVVDPPPAEVTLTGLAAATIDADDRQGPPAWDHATGTCSNVYCHGDVLGDGAATNTRPSWTGGPSQVTCGSCHGHPPESHADDRCAVCHPQDAPHIDGVISVGTQPGCNGCHGDSTSPAPPRGLLGETFTTSLAVGAHRSHLDGRHRLRGPLACSDCHDVPTAIEDPGHIDSPPPAEVSPADGTWDRTTATCSGTWCHGQATPLWTDVGGAEIACGSCHDVPPAAFPHSPTMTIDQCSMCHTSTIDSFGNFFFNGPPGHESEHMDGNVDF